ncbi:Oidioi.mRNA.OKI2018_I69.chr2.g6998.t1.cds [Oikopleura dioica]|uniref:glutaminase n=1 Tax=Oikopleura dioica TaxID=34765 RepID=A0ABN7T9K7_OIKDI|nr:Oidioi.mRNA.OKI2018_I69.chr2.g6998.t1.cds [Oikopleura dioica]
MVMNAAKRKRVLTKFRKVVHEIGRQRLGTDFDVSVEHPLSLADMKPRDSTGESISTGEDVLEEFREIGRASTGDEELEMAIFDRSKTPQGNLDRQRFIRVIRRTGLQLDDPRLDQIRRNIDECHNFIMDNIDDDEVHHGIDFLCFRGIINNNQEILYQAFNNQFVISDFPTFLTDIREMYIDASNIQEGHFTEYTRYLKEYHSTDEWGVSFCSVDGQRAGFGSNKQMFTLQSLMNPFLYAMSLDDMGPEKIHSIVGQETSGGQYNVIKLDDKGRPHNPMANAGAILLSSLYKQSLNKSERHGTFLAALRKVGGLKASAESSLSFDYAAFMSEREDCHRNSSICYYLREKKCIDTNMDVEQVLDVYTQMCNVTVNTDSLSVLAATLANGGICPITGEQCFSNDAVKSTLSCMLAAGMNDHSGIWAFTIGLPAKSGISGGTMIIIPNVMGIALYSPKIDKSANSARAAHFASVLNAKFHFHEYDPVRLKSTNFSNNTESDTAQLIKLMIAAENNDVNRLIFALINGFDLSKPGYLEMTLLHIAASKGHLKTIQFLINKAKVPQEPLDQNSRTPLDYAIMHDHQDVIEFLRKSIKVPSRDHTIINEDDLGTGRIPDDLKKKMKTLSMTSASEEEDHYVLEY